MYKVYMYINKINQKKYIGITKMTLKKRAGKNGKKYYGCLYFGNAIKKYGWENFTPLILFENLSYEEACLKEKEMIKYYDTRNKEKGYNLQEGGQGPNQYSLIKMRKSHKNKKLTEEHKKNISKGLGGKGKNNVNFGKKQTEIARLHNSLSKKGEKHHNFGKHLSDSTKEKIRKKVSKPILQYDLDGNFIKRWENQRIAGKELNISYKAISKCLNKKSKSSGGFMWLFENEK